MIVKDNDGISIHPYMISSHHPFLYPSFNMAPLSFITNTTAKEPHARLNDPEQGNQVGDSPSPFPIGMTLAPNLPTPSLSQDPTDASPPPFRHI